MNCTKLWETASEAENAGFEVERAIGGVSYRPIAFVEGAGTTTEPQTYRHADEDIPFTAKRARYRLRQVDHDGISSGSSRSAHALTCPSRRPVSLETVDFVNRFPQSLSVIFLTLGVVSGYARNVNVRKENPL